MASEVSRQSGISPSRSSSPSAEEIDCVMCHERLEDKVHAFACHHMFHKECFEILINKSACPMCHAAAIISPAESKEADSSQKPQDQETYESCCTHLLGDPLRREKFQELVKKGYSVSDAFMLSRAFSLSHLWPCF